MEKLKSKRFQIDEELDRLLKIYCANTKQTQQQVFVKALTAYVTEKGRRY